MSNVLQIIADVDRAVKGLNRLQRSVDQFVDASSKAGQSLGGGVNRALDVFADLAKGGAAAAGALAGTFLATAAAAVTMTVRAGQIAEQTDELAQKTGIAAMSLEGLSVAMARHGLEAGNISTAIKGLSKAMGGMEQGAASSIDLFSTLGITLETVAAGTGATLRAVADAFAKMPDGAEKARLATELFGKAGLDLIPILNKGAAGLDAAMNKASEFGLILSESARSALTTFDDSVDDLQSSLKGFAMQVGAAFAPSLTALVHGMTSAVVVVKDVFNLFADAGEKLTIRLGAMAASVSVIAQQLFSFSALSKDAWTQTLNQVKAIDQWAAAQIHGVDATRAASAELATLAEKQMGAAKAADAHAVSQQRLGEQIVKFVQIQQSIAKSTSQEVFSKLFEADEIEQANRYLGPMARTFEEIEQREAALVGMHSDLQKGIDAQTQAYIEMANAADAALVAETAAEVVADQNNQKYQGEYLRTQQIAAAAMKSTWQQQLESIVASNTFSVGQIVTGWTSGLANAIVNFQNFGQTMTQIGKQTAATLLQGILQFGIQSAVQWALQASTVTAIKSAEAAAVVGINTAKNAAIVAGDAAGATGTVSIWGGAGAAMVGLFGTIAGAIQGLIMGTILPSMIETGISVELFLSSIASALDASVFGAPFSIPVWAAVGLVGAAIASIAAFAFADGGIATGPTLGMIGEAGSSEAVIPLNKRGASFMREVVGGGSGGVSRIEVPVYLDGRKVATGVAKYTGYAWRKMGAPA